MGPLVSVIVPVYNVEQYLGYCLDSIINQTYTKLEILLIDDAATDRSAEICRQYQMKDPRIVLLHHEKNLGLSEARNTGLNHCQGDYITFVDSDDMIHPRLIEALLLQMEKSDADLIYGGWRHCAEEDRGTYQEIDLSNLYTEEMDNHQMMKTLFSLDVGVAVWGILYTRKALEGKRFVPGLYYEDTVFLPQVLASVKKVVYVPEAFYQYRSTRSGISRVVSKRSIDRMRAFNIFMKLVKKHFPELYETSLAKMYNICLAVQFSILDLSDKQLQRTIQKAINYYWKKYKPTVLDIIKAGYPLHNKCIYLLSKISLRKAAILKYKLLTLNDWRIDHFRK